MAKGKRPQYKQGVFKPLYPQKYKGNPTKIFYRSSLELKVMNELDRNPNVLTWSSEETIIPYRSPIDGRVHRYFIDFVAELIKPDQSIEKVMIEVKPASQCKPPVKKAKLTKRYVEDVKTWGINSAKWEAARDFCRKRGYKFQILTERDIHGT